MARKDLPKGLMNAPQAESETDAETGEARVDTGRPRYSGGAIGRRHHL